MIDMVSISEFMVTPIASTLLPCVLFAYIAFGMLAGRIHNARPAIVIHYSQFLWMLLLPLPILLTNFCCVFLSPLTCSRLNFELVGLLIFPISLFDLLGVFLPVSFSFFSNLVLVLISIPLFQGANVIAALFTIFAGVLGLTRFTPRAESAFDMGIAMKELCRSWELITAKCTAFHWGVHSASLSLSRCFVASGGASDHFSGATLDAYGDYTLFRGLSKFGGEP